MFIIVNAVERERTGAEQVKCSSKMSAIDTYTKCKHPFLYVSYSYRILNCHTIQV